jgi:hypothetical protein
VGERNSQGEAEVPRSFPNVLPPNISADAGYVRIIVNAIEENVKELRNDVREINSQRHPDFIFYISIFAAGFVVLAGMMIVGYLKLDDKIGELDRRLIRVDTKLEDLLQRIPPIPTPPIRH